MDNYTRVHMIGIGGIGISALARLLMHEGKVVSGSDRSASDITRALAAEGVKIYDEQVTENITDDIEFVIYSGAVTEDNLERTEALRRGIPSMNYFEALGLAVNSYYLIAIAGTHGKTTTTAMTIDIFERAGKDPTGVVGSLRAGTHSNFRAGQSKYAIVEACEYRRHYLNLEPDILVVTNVEYEHVDYYKDLADVQSAFRELAERVPEEGFIVCDATSESVKPILANVQATVIDYRKYVDPLMLLQVPGLHNRMNAAAAIAAAVSDGISETEAKVSLADFAGTWRRFEYKGETSSGAKVYDDYGHHPSEIRATLQGARDMYKDKKITIVFQPHTYSRFRELFDDFAVELAKADRVILVPIYAAREANTNNDSSEQLVEAIQKTNPNAAYFDAFDAVAKEIGQTADANDVILVMGAGDVTNIASLLTIG